MYETPISIKKAIRRNEAITAEGLTLYPIRVAEIEEFQVARPAIDIMQQALPVRFISMPLLQAYFQMDAEALASGQPKPGLFYRALLFLALALRLGVGEDAQRRVLRFVPRVYPEDHTRLKAVNFILDGEQISAVTPVQFQRLRPILAAQNGIELESDDANPELVQAERDLAEANAPKLDFSTDSLIESVAALSGVDEYEIDMWPIRKLLARQRALSRALGYVVCGIGEMQGAKWKSGNPFPSPIFARQRDGNAALVPIESFAGGAAAEAVNHPTAAGFNPLAAITKS